MAQRLYSIYSVDSTGKRKRYRRLSDLALPLEQARTFWQDMLLSLGLGGQFRELRPVK